MQVYARAVASDINAFHRTFFLGNQHVAIDLREEHYSHMKNKNLKTLSPTIRMDVSSSGQHLDLFLIGYVGDWGNSIEDFLFRIRQMPNLITIDVYISSLGGCFEDGLPIFNVLKMHDAFVTTKVIGYACSMASVIMLAGDKVQASQNAIIMIHRAQGMTWGDADDMLKMADILAIHEKSVMPEYMTRMNKTEAEVLALLKAETWYNAKPALDAGLIDEIIDTIDINSPDAIPQIAPDDDGEEDAITTNAAKYALEHYKNIPTNLRLELEKATGTKEQQTLFTKFLNFIGKDYAPQMSVVEPNTTMDDLEMTKEDLQALMADNNKVLLQHVADMMKPPEPAPADDATLIAELKAQIVELQAKTAVIDEIKAELTTFKEQLQTAMDTSDMVNIDLSVGAAGEDGEKY